jgi:hypothetical protein
MTTEPPEVRAMRDPEGKLEQALIDEFLRARGHDSHSLHALPEDERKHLQRGASLYAATKLAEVEARAHFVHEIHGGTEPDTSGG